MRFTQALLLVSITLISAPLYGATYKLSMLPRYSSEEINQRITPLARYLSDKTGHQIKVVITSDFSQYEKQLKKGTIDLGYENPYIYTLVSESHEVLAMAVKGKNKDKFRGIVITRTDSPLSGLKDLKGKTVSIVGYTSAGGYLSQKLSLMEEGIDVKTEINITEAINNKQENVILAVYTGEADAGFIRESARHKVDGYIAASRIKVVAECAWLPNWSFSVKRTLPAKLKKEIQAALLDLKANHDIMKALKIDGFKPAVDQDYDPVRRASGREE